MSRNQKPLGHLVSAKVKPASGSASAISGQQPVVEVITLQSVAVCVGILSLLSLAGLGIYFTIKQNSLKANRTVRTIQPIVNVQEPVVHALASSPSVRPKSKLVEPVVPVQANGFVPSGSAGMPPRATPPGEPSPETVVGREPTAAVPAERPRPDATLAPPMPTAEVVKKRPDDIGRLPLPMKPGAGKDEQFGTKIDFLPTPHDAYEQLKKQTEKLAMIVQYGGGLEKGRVLNDNFEAFLNVTLTDNAVVRFVNEQFVSSTQKFPAAKANGQAASVVTYFCRADGSVLHAIAGPVDPGRFLREAQWVLDTRKSAIAEMKGSLALYASYFNKVHRERYLAESDDEDGVFNPMKRPGAMKKGFPGPGGPGFPAPAFPGLPPGFPDFGGFPGFAQPVPQPRKFPAVRPVNASAQAQIHWLLGSRNSPKLSEIEKIIYPAVLRERNGE